MRVISEIRTPRSRTTPALAAKTVSSSSRRPKSLSSIAPPTLKRSVIALPRSALPSICSRVSPASLVPTTREVMSRIGKQQQAQQGDLPAQGEHRDAHHDHGDRVGDRARQGGRERPLGADHVVVEPGDERAGLGAGEERQALALHVAEDLGAEVEDQALADARGEPAAQHRQRGADDRHARHRQGQQGDQRAVAGGDAVVDQALDEQRVDHDEARVDDGQQQEHRDEAAVRAREGEHAAYGPAADAARHLGPVGAHVAEDRPPAAGSGVAHHRHVVLLRRASRGRGSPRSTGPRPRRGAAGPGRARGLARLPRRG